MDFKSVLKRILPFAVTLTVGLFIASFFVSVGLPKFERRAHRHHQFKQMKSENEQLRKDNCRMKRQIADLEKQKLESQVPPVTTTMPMESVNLKK